MGLEGGCSCGAVRYRLTSDPLFVHCCHCLNCQRQTGSAFVINLLIEAERVEIVTGDPQPVDVPRDDGSAQPIFRCPRCQTALYSRYGHPAVCFVRAGTPHRMVTPNPEIVMAAQHDLGYRAILNGADLAIPDGVGLLLAARLAGERLRAPKTCRGNSAESPVFQQS